MKNSERILLGVALVVGAIAGIGSLLVLPAWQTMGDAQAKIASLETQVSDLKTQKMAANTNLVRYSKPIPIPADLTIRTFGDHNLEQNLKEMLDQVIRLGTRSGNNLISLEPMADPGLAPPAPPASTPANKGATLAGQANTGPATSSSMEGQPITGSGTTTPTSGKDATTKPEPPNAISLLKVYRYNMAFRGNYANLLAFLSSLNQHTELIEIMNINLQNEGGAQRTLANTASTPGSNGSNVPVGAGKLYAQKPLKLTLQLRLVLQPDTAVATTTPSLPPSTTMTVPK
jgi:hypothetical protein